jgi:hypothetical protein
VDPDEALAQAREAVRVLQGPGPSGDAEERLLEAFVALDGWIVGGGFLPAAWRRDEHG